LGVARDYEANWGLQNQYEPIKADWKALNKTTDWLVILTILKNIS
jgi:hypothetical protein